MKKWLRQNNNSLGIRSKGSGYSSRGSNQNVESLGLTSKSSGYGFRV